MAPERTTKVSTNDSKDNVKPKKRAPSAYNIFMGVHLKAWRVEHPDVPVKDGMTAVAALWRDSPENPNRGKPSKPKKLKNGASSTNPSSDAAGPSSES